MKERRRTTLIALFVLAVVFSAGAMVSATLLDGEPAPILSARTEIATGSVGLEELGLSARQKAEVDSIFAAHRPRIDAIIGAALDDLRSVLDSVDVDVRGVLRPDQVAAYQRLREEGGRVRAITRTRRGSDDSVRVDTIR